MKELQAFEKKEVWHRVGEKVGEEGRRKPGRVKVSGKVSGEMSGKRLPRLDENPLMTRVLEVLMTTAGRIEHTHGHGEGVELTTPITTPKATPITTGPARGGHWEVLK
jgi:hypothetical protein